MIYIPETDHIFTKAEAAKWTRARVIVKKTDLERIKRLAKKHGFAKELVALGIEVHPIGFKTGKCTCSKRLQTLGLHSSECPVMRERG